MPHGRRQVSHLCRCRFSSRAGLRHILSPVLLAVALAMGTGAPAQAQSSAPSFREPPAGSPVLKPVCRVPSLVGRGGVINLADPKAEADRRLEKLRGVATRLVELKPFRTEIAVSVSAEGADKGAVEARLDDLVATVVAALATTGAPMIDQAAGPTALVPQTAGAGLAPFSGTREVVFDLQGDVDPLPAFASLPAGFPAALRHVTYRMPEASAVVDALRPDLERQARDDAVARAGARGEGVKIGNRVELRFTDDDRTLALRSGGRRMIAVSAVATYTLSRPPGSSAASE